MIKLLLTLLYVAYVKTRNTTVDYCSLNCSLSENAACSCPLDSDFSNSPDCMLLRPTMLPLTDDNKMKFVGLHNRNRNAEAETDKSINNMYAFMYDDELEYVAACWAMKCKQGHDTCRRTAQYDNVAQNLFWPKDDFTRKFCTVESIIKKAVRKWYKTPFSEEYRVVVFPKAKRFGCAVISYLQRDCRLYCNYAPIDEAKDSLESTESCPHKHKYFENLCIDSDFDLNSQRTNGGSDHKFSRGRLVPAFVNLASTYLMRSFWSI